MLSPNGNTNTVPFTVTAPALPTLTSITPNSGVRGGGPVSVTLTGTNLTGATAVNIVGANITIGSFTVNGCRNANHDDDQSGDQRLNRDPQCDGDHA